jgi:hypothetical protein
MMFLGAPERVRQALVDYVVRGHKRASKILGAFIDENQYRIRASQPVKGPLATRGRYHDLGAILADVADRYFPGAVGDVLITWGRRTRPHAEARRTIKLGSYSATERLVRIHPAARDHLGAEAHRSAAAVALNATGGTGVLTL